MHQVQYNEYMLLKAIDNDEQGQFYEVGQANEISNKIKLASDAYIKANSTLVFTVVGAYGFSVLQNPHVVEANKDGNYLELAKQNCIMTDGMQITVEEGTLDMGVPGTYTVVYQATNGVNEIGSLSVKVIVVDKIKPTIEYDGETTMVDGIETIHIRGMINTIDYSKILNKFTVADNTTAGATRVETQVSEKAIDTSEVGTYIMDYYAQDESGNRSEKTYRVIVEVTPYVVAPKITGREVGVGGGKDTIENITYTYALEIYTSNTTSVIVEYRENSTSTPTSEPCASLNGRIFDRNGIYKITAKGDGGERSVEFTIDISN